MHLARVWDHRHAVGLAQGVDLVRGRDAAHAVGVVLNHAHRFLVEQLLEAVKRELVFTARDRDAGELVELGVAVDVVGDHRLFEPARFELFELGQDAFGVLQVPAHITLEHQVVFITDDFTHRFHGLEVFRHAGLTVRRAVAEAHLEGLETLVLEFLGFLLHRLEVGAVELAVVAGNLLLGAAAQQLEHGLVDRLAQDVPDGQVHRRDGGHGHALAAPGVGGAVHALPQVFVVPGVLADDQGRQVLVDDGLGDLGRQGHIAQADDAVVGLHFHHGPGMETEGAHGLGLGVEQVHGVGAEVALGRNGLALPFEDTGTDGFDFHDGLSGRQARRTHAAGDEERLFGGADVGAALAGDVVGRAMRGRGDGDGQAALHRHALGEAHELDRDLALVVVHGDDGIELSVTRLQEDGVGRERSGDVQAFGLECTHRRFDDLDLLASAGAAVPAVRGEGRPRHPGPGRTRGL